MIVTKENKLVTVGYNISVPVRDYEEMAKIVDAYEKNKENFNLAILLAQFAQNVVSTVRKNEEYIEDPFE